MGVSLAMLGRLFEAESALITALERFPQAPVVEHANAMYVVLLFQQARLYSISNRLVESLITAICI
jgi:hypothetical protein